MASNVEICNLALVKLGASLISALDSDGSVESRTCHTAYPLAVDLALRSYDWACASHRATLAQLSESPVWGFSYAYSLPNDPFCLSVREIEEDAKYKVEGRTLVSTSATATIRYTRRITDPGLFDPALSNAISCLIAYNIGFALTSNRSLVNDMKAEYDEAIANAKNQTSSETGVEVLRDAVLVSVRK